MYFDAYYRAQEAYHELEAATLVQQHGLEADAETRRRRVRRLAEAASQNAACQAKSFSSELTFTAAVVSLQNSLRAFMNNSDTLITLLHEDDAASVETLLTLMGAMTDIVGTAVGRTPTEGLRASARLRRRQRRRHLVPHQQEIAFSVPQSMAANNMISLQFASGLVVAQELPDGAQPGERFSAGIPVTPIAAMAFDDENKRCVACVCSMLCSVLLCACARARVSAFAVRSSARFFFA